MKIQDLQTLYAHSPKVKSLTKAIDKPSAKPICLEGLVASAAPVVFSALRNKRPFLFILQDVEQAGYFYHDLMQLSGGEQSDSERQVLFFPSSYKRAIKYGQKDAASEILRTEVLSVLKAQSDKQLFIVTFPEALAEMVVTRQQLDTQTLTLQQGQTVDVNDVLNELRQLGFREVDYVYEPGQFALRGSILDVFSYSNEYPFRIDFFGDDIDSIRTFEVEDQLSKERRQRADIMPEMSAAEQKESLLTFMPSDALLVMRDAAFVRQAIEHAYQEGFSTQAMRERLEGANEMEAKQIEKEMQRDSHIITGTQFATQAEQMRHIIVRPSGDDFHISPQPLFHKNFEMLSSTLEDYMLKGYKLYILADSAKQTERLKEILNSESHAPKGDAHSLHFTPVDKTLHEGFNRPRPAAMPLHRPPNIRPLPQVQPEERQGTQRQGGPDAEGDTAV
ncbi:MAG: hypothetical protein IKG77_04105 [Prevotella sp.]|nr:hypothetical protein [Prevotella sp.]